MTVNKNPFLTPKVAF